MSYNIGLPIGGDIRGKWGKRVCRIERLLGQGANGKVYLVRRDECLYALKLGYDPLDLQLEMNVLRDLQQQEGISYLLETDDVEIAGVVLPYYMMKYVAGKELHHYLRQFGMDWSGLLGLQLLRKLAELHRSGWVFCDLKESNMLISAYGEVELIDYGGATKIGRSARQFTELYDRGYWNCGTRTAEPPYDLFAMALLWLNMLGQGEKLREASTTQRNVSYLLGLIKQAAVSESLKEVLEKLVRGGFVSAQEAAEQWRAALYMAVPRSRQPLSRLERWLPALFTAALAAMASTAVYYVYG